MQGAQNAMNPALAKRLFGLGSGAITSIMD
jgi:hypothetical protein